MKYLTDIELEGTIKLPVWTETFNGTERITNDWKMWWNGYNLDKLKEHLDKHMPSLLANQTLREMSTPLIEEVPARTYCECVLLNGKEMFYYPICLHWFDKFVEGIVENTIEIPQHIIEKIRNKTAKILLYHPREQWGHSAWKKMIDEISAKYVLPQEHFVVSCNNPKLKNINSVPLMHNQRLVQDPAYFETTEQMWSELSRLISDPQPPNEINGQGKRPWKFVCLMRRPNTNRWAISAELMEYKLNGDSLMSMVCDVNLIEANLPIGSKDLDTDYYNIIRENYWTKNSCTLPGWAEVAKQYPQSQHKLEKYDKEYPFWIMNDTNALTNPLTDPQIWKFTNTYLHVVSETFVDDDAGVCLSEKIFKPIWYMQPFIVFGTPYTLSALKDLGYMTFDKWIDESYDSIENKKERFYSAVASVKKFANNSNEKLDEIMQEMLPVLQHNTRVLRRNNNSLTSNFINTAIDALKYENRKTTEEDKPKRKYIDI